VLNTKNLSEGHIKYIEFNINFSIVYKKVNKLKKSYYKISYRHHGAYNETKFDYLRHGLAFCKKEQKDRVKKKKKLFASVAEASSTTGT